MQNNTFGLLNTGDSRLTFFENTISNSPKVLRAKFLGSDRLFFVSIYEVWQLQEPFCNDYLPV